MPIIRTWQLATGATAVGLALAAGAVALAGPWESGRRTAEHLRAAELGSDTGTRVPPLGAAGPDRPAPAPSAPRVLGALGTPTPAGPADGKPRGLGEELAPLLRDPGLGPLRGASVVDVATGRLLYGQGDTVAMTPASTIKIATAVAALDALGPDHRVPTTVVAAGDRLTLVGGGDASLTRTGLADLAERTARALRARDAGEPKPVRLAYDTSLYRGNPLHPIGRNGNLAPVTALMADAGRIDPKSTGYADRSDDPAGDASRAFARMLDDRGVRVADAARPGRPAKGSRPLAGVHSPPLSALVERMLTDSDNDLAEALARQTALASGEPASFAGGERAVRKRLSGLGLPLAGARFADGSGLDRRDRLSARLLTALLTRAAEPGRPALRPVLTGLPVAGFTGTLQSRYAGTAPGGGVVRAKTGTLTGVGALSGTAPGPDGRLLAFAFLAGGTPGRESAQDALDRLAGALVS
ncbi:D-alanyl-D-alanine carboxypeptidase/D-alanyl-D-alanine endopeptidase [Streptomyces yaizuensis]|uniref:D-alanyl-D-alanine carboxypeptidase/D-alanyl-D-alanine-endopeptidase n=1 Tax=Streptomyces yaizuensis TaxID=2989713 RepID=A0ABQ5P0D2_9ACTN|nr:D-alanyl-D-alanine carboxypeptidase/D-alanyl-D-alanine-endopeptidase [Streptomyces sp. YSPA8]GLF96062.1 D-alanyl-D-alanine carboxypeptidase/D-alanyl-D-alanine-endopeptidase [Streptomyces sp. YSPA8]